LLQTNTNTSIQTFNVVIISKKKRGRDKIKSTGNGKRFHPKTVNGETVAIQWLSAELQR
jgi:hypothetical protein